MQLHHQVSGSGWAFIYVQIFLTFFFCPCACQASPSQRNQVFNLQCIDSHPIITSCKQECSIWTEGNTTYAYPTSIKREQFLTRSGVPQFRCSVPAGCGKSFAVRAKCDAHDRTRMATKTE